ncbi:MAG: Aspartokinase [uncultured Thermomicrobiales bacterium]|uniref:Aspartokinase n=1 Tax=uncultured Thermomicrobiales bacterium TaxID=1645740 RepID=A0A6J4VFI9_9BACT|nr:MAG: Aspartokinase [uncultured Thermomicrobiales bacterium]
MTVVMKFGGTSVGGGRQLRGVAEIVARRLARGEDGGQPPPPVVVASAMRGVTDRLLAAASAAARGDRAASRAALRLLREQHLTAVEEALDEHATRHEVGREVSARLAQLRRILTGVTLLGELSPRSLDRVAGWGEGCLVPILAGALRERGVAAAAIGAERVIVTDERFGAANPDLAATSARAAAILRPLLDAGTVPVIGGFVGATPAGAMTTLGRGGSDFSASILGHALGAREVWIWTDVNGVLSADPRLVPDARPLPALSYAEAGELSYFGAKVLHPRTIVPAAAKGIPLRILNTFEPEFPGTIIAGEAPPAEGVVRALTSIGQATLITVEGAGLVGGPRIVARACAVLAECDANILMLSQSSSEHNICFVVPSEAGERLRESLEHEFAAELARGELSSVTVEREVCILAVVGAGMRGTPGVAGRVFGTLGRHGCNILAIAQGGSEMNISCVVHAGDEARAMRALHDELVGGGHPVIGSERVVTSGSL